LGKGKNVFLDFQLAKKVLQNKTTKTKTFKRLSARFNFYQNNDLLGTKEVKGWFYQ
jgi:hypothetical protein